MFFLGQIDKPITSLVLTLQASGQIHWLADETYGGSIFHRAHILAEPKQRAFVC